MPGQKYAMSALKIREHVVCQETTVEEPLACIVHALRDKFENKTLLEKIKAILSRTSAAVCYRGKEIYPYTPGGEVRSEVELRYIICDPIFIGLVELYNYRASELMYYVHNQLR